MNKFHINNDYEVKPCKATLMPCRFKEHYSDEKIALQQAEKLLLKENDSIATLETLNKLSKNIRVTGVLNEKSFNDLDPITQKTVIAGINRINPKLSIKEQEYWQSIYDQSPAGNIALKRLQRTNPHEFAKKQELAQKYPFNEVVVDFRKVEKNLSNHPQKKMIMLSATWMSNMSPEEIDSIYWITTHGAGIINKHMRGEEHPSAHNYSEEFLNKQSEMFLSAMKKAPSVKNPITLYRGTREKNLISDNLNSPASSSTDSQIAENFAKQKTNSVIMKISTTKIPSVVTMSSWGIKESEILAPLGNYRTTGEKQLNNTKIVELEFID